jgi:malate permease and related proteins
MALLADLFAIVAPVLVCVALGYGWARAAKPYPLEFMAQLTTRLATPCLIFSSLTRLDLTPAALAEMALVSLAVLGLSVALGVVFLRLAGLKLSHFLPSILFGNSGNIGPPICLFAFGEVGLALAVAFFAIVATAQFSLGVWINSGKLDPRPALKEPMLLATLAAAAFILAGVKPPAWIANSVQIVAGIAIPGMLITLGVSLATLRLTALRLSLTLAIGRLAIGLLAGLALAEAFGLTGPARGVVIIQSAMPIAVTNYILSLRFSGRSAEVAAACLVSTLIGFASLPVLLLLAR